MKIKFDTRLEQAFASPIDTAGLASQIERYCEQMQIDELDLTPVKMDRLDDRFSTTTMLDAINFEDDEEFDQDQQHEANRATDLLVCPQFQFANVLDDIVQSEFKDASIIELSLEEALSVLRSARSALDEESLLLLCFVCPINVRTTGAGFMSLGFAHDQDKNLEFGLRLVTETDAVWTPFKSINQVQLQMLEAAVFEMDTASRFAEYATGSITTSLQLA